MTAPRSGLTTIGLVALVALLAMPAPATAQATAWDAPLLLPPRPEASAGVYLIQPHRRDVGIMGSWRLGGSPHVGLRLGIADNGGDGLSGFAGVDLSGPVTRANDEFPLDISWVFGSGAAAGPGLRISIPAGLVVGHTFVADNVQFTPHGSPRIILDGMSQKGRQGDNSTLDLGFAMDLGVDLALQPGWFIRFGLSFGNRSALAVGVEF